MIEALVFPEAFQRLGQLLKPATPLLVKGRVAIEDVGTRVIVSDARLLDQVADPPPSLLRVRLDLREVDPGPSTGCSSCSRAVPDVAAWHSSWCRTMEAKPRSKHRARCARTEN